MKNLPDTVPTRVFLSYARGDDESFVRRLHADLTKAGFTVWFDRESLMSRGLTFHQEIKDAIRTEVDRVVYVGGPKAALSAYVREEWRFALECDHVVVTPILRLADYDNVPGELSLLHCEDFRDDAKYAAALAKLVHSLSQPNPKLGALFAVPNLPPNFLGRPELMRQVRDALLVDLQKPQVITSVDAKVGMQGMGGIGKSVLAAALARNREVRQSYPDGVIWVACGQKLDAYNLLKLQRDLARHLGGDDTFASLSQGQGILRQLLAAKAVLLVLDDVWHAKDAQGFDVLGPRCRMLVTTRDAGILHALHGNLVPVSLFTEAEALQLLADAVGVAPATLPPEAAAVVKECGCLPLALALSGGMAKKHGGNFRSVLERLRRADLDKIADRESINEQHRSIWQAMQASVEMLSDEEQKRFAELAVFETESTVPDAAAVVLWKHTGNLDDLDTEDLLVNLFERSLIQLDQKTDADGKILRRFRLHDLLHDYAMRIAGELRASHQKLLDAYRKKCSDGWHTGPDDGYFFQNICQHLATAAGNWDEAVVLLCDLRFVEARCRVGQVFELIADYRLAQENLPEAQADLREEREREERVQRWTAEIIAYAKAWSARLDRLAGGEKVPETEPTLPAPPPSCPMWTEEEIQEECDRIIQRPAQRDRLEEFAGFVSGQCYPLLEHGLRPGFVRQHAFNTEPAGAVHDAAASLLPTLTEPHILHRWPKIAFSNFKPSLCLTLEGHNDAVKCVNVTPDGRRAVSASADNTLRVWDLKSGQCLHTLKGHVGSLCRGFLRMDDDGNIIALSYQEAVKNRPRGVLSVSITPDGRRAVSGSDYNTIQVWDLENGICLRTLESDHRGLLGSSLDKSSRRAILSISVTPDGRRAVLGSDDHTMQVWDLESGACLLTLKGHNEAVKSVSVTADGRRAVAAYTEDAFNPTALFMKSGLPLLVWDLESGECLHILKGHSYGVLSVSVTPDGRWAVSGGVDKTLRVWDLENGECLRILQGHNSSIEAVVVTPDGRRVISGSYDDTLRVWDLESGECLRTLEGHSRGVTSVSVTADGLFAVSGSYDKTLRVWDLEKRKSQCTLESRRFMVDGVSITLDGRRAVSVRNYSVMKVWDLEKSACIRTLEGDFNAAKGFPTHYDGQLSVVSMTPDGRLAVIPGPENTFQLWDLENYACLRILKGHRSGVCSVSVTPDGRKALSGSRDGTIRIWDLNRGQCLRILTVQQIGRFIVSMTPDSRYAVSVDDSHLLQVWDLESGQCLRKVPSPSPRILFHDEVPVVSVTPDGRWAVSGRGDHLLWLWDLGNGKCLRTLEGHDDLVYGVSVTPDGRRAVSGSKDRSVRMWDLETGKCLSVYPASAPVSAVALNFAGNLVCVGTITGEVFSLDLRDSGQRASAIRQNQPHSESHIYIDRACQ